MQATTCFILIVISLRVGRRTALRGVINPFNIRIHTGNRRRGILEARFQRPLLLRDLEQRGIKLYERVVHRGVIGMTFHAPGDVFA